MRGAREALIEATRAWLAARATDGEFSAHAPGVDQRQLRRRPRARGFSGPGDAGLRQAAGLSRQRRLGAEAASRARPHPQAYTAEYANVHRGLHYLANAATEAYEGAREKVRASSTPAGAEEIIFTRNATEAINLVAAYVRARAYRRRRRDRALDHGAPLQHRALAFPARAPWRGDQMGAGRRRRQFLPGRLREAADRPHQDGRDHPDVERAGHGRAGEGGVRLAHARGIRC